MYSHELVLVNYRKGSKLGKLQSTRAAADSQMAKSIQEINSKKRRSDHQSKGMK